MSLYDVVPWVALIAIFYFLVIKPERDRAAERTRMLSGLQKDEKVVVAGMHGKIASVDEDSLLIEIADKTRVRVDRDAVTRKLD